MAIRASKHYPLGSGGLLVGPGFAAIAVWFVWGPDLAALPTPGETPIPAAMISTAPRRTTLGDPPKIHINGFDRTCMECHRTFQSPKLRTTGRLQHEHVVVEHGSHRGCYGCHDQDDRDRLVTIGGETLPFGQAADLCAQCHASVHADWRAGMHGRTNGYWSAPHGDVRRLTCTQCHDPHAPRSPAMDPIVPLPGPNTLRMGEPTSGAGHTGDTEHVEDPLRRALLGGAGRGDGGSHAGEGRPGATTPIKTRRGNQR